jgi:hypothetical protein
MRKTRITMGMPAGLAVPNPQLRPPDMDIISAEFAGVDAPDRPVQVRQMPSLNRVERRRPNTARQDDIFRTRRADLTEGTRK